MPEVFDTSTEKGKISVGLITNIQNCVMKNFDVTQHQVQLLEKDKVDKCNELINAFRNFFQSYSDNLIMFFNIRKQQNETNIDDVDELSEIKISRKKSKEEKILDFISKTKNPYIFKVNNKLVKIECNDNGTNAEEAITNVIKSIYR
jgi:hypothetical protein